jgi:hypothetical protein
MVRVFWCVYTWDRLSCIDTGRSFTLRDEDVQLPRPTEYHDDGWLTQPAYALLRLAISLSPLEEDHGLTLSPIAMECAYENLLEWNNTVARSLGFGQDKAFIHVRPEIDPALYCHIRMQYYDAILQIYGQAIYAILDPSLDFNNPTGSCGVCLSASKSIITCLQELASLGVLENCWWLKLQCLQSAVTILLVFLNAGYDQQSIGSYLNVAFEMIDKLTADGRFGMAKECQWALRMLNKMVHLRLKNADSFTTSIGFDTGIPTVNDSHFTNAGTVDESGNVIPAHTDDSDTRSQAHTLPMTDIASPSLQFPGLSQDLLSADIFMELESSLSWFAQ